MKRSDIPTAMDKAIEYFVDHEMYEDAVKAKKAKDLFQESK
jgi:diacylglycerol kinase